MCWPGWLAAEEYDTSVYPAKVLFKEDVVFALGDLKVY